MEDLKEIDLSEEPEESKLKRISLIIGGIFLTILVVSYIFVSWPMSSIISGQLESEPVKENVIEADDLTIIFEDETYAILKSWYFEEQSVEFSVCLLGEKKGKNYHITSLYQPKIFHQAFNEVRFEPCKKETLILLHTHPYKSCIASDVDLRMLNKSKEENPDVIMVVMCEPERISVYS